MPRSALLHNKNFRFLWASSALTSFGGHISALAIPFTAAQLLHATPAQMGVMIACGALPFALLSLHAGVLVDRMHKIPLMRACDLSFGLLILLIPVLWWLGRLTLPLMYAIDFLIGVVFCITGVAGQVFLTQLVGRDQLVDANAKFMGTESAARLMGPGLAGLLIQWLTAPFAVLMDAIGIFCSWHLLGRIRHEERLARAGRDGVWSEIKAGLRLVWTTPILRAAGLGAAGWQILVHGYLALQVLFALRVLGLSAGEIGTANMAGGVGALLATLVAKRLAGRWGAGPAMLFGYALTGLAWAAMALLPRAHAVLTLGLCILCFDFGITVLWINYSSLRQAITPDAFLGRMTATMRWIAVTLAPLGSLAFGWMAEHLGLRAALGAIAAGGLLLPIALAFTAVRRAEHVTAPA